MAYLKYFGEQVNDIVCVRSYGLYCNNKGLFAGLGMGFLLVMANLKNFKQLSLISYIANFTVVLALTSIYIDGAFTLTYKETPTEIKYFDIGSLPSFVALVASSMEGTALLPGIYASTQDKISYPCILFSAVTLDGVLTLLVSTVGYLAYGSSIKEIVIMNLSPGIVS